MLRMGDQRRLNFSHYHYSHQATRRRDQIQKIDMMEMYVRFVNRPLLAVLSPWLSDVYYIFLLALLMSAIV